MNIYKLLKVYTKIRSPKVKALGLLVMHLLRRRYTCLFFDPVLACNLRCRMCYFSDAERRKTLHGMFSDADVSAIAASLFPYLMKLQIGCGAEPTLYRGLSRIVKLGKRYGVPYISITTNGNLLAEEKMLELVDAGLDEITISLHGARKETYEYFMRGADFGKFNVLLDTLRKVKRERPDFCIRVNYTVNEDNVDDLRYIPQLFDGLSVNVLQLRPVQKIGESEYSNFSMSKVLDKYDECIMSVVNYCRQNGVLCIYPSKDNIRRLSEGAEEGATDSRNGVIDMLPHFYLSPYEGWKSKIDPYHENFYDCCRRERRVGKILRFLLSSGKKEERDSTKAMNYKVK